MIPYSTRAVRAALQPITNNHTWMQQASCAGLPPETADYLFFPPDGGNYPKAAKKMCAACPVKQECGEYGDGEAYGLYGGLTPGQRDASAVAS